MAIELNRHDPRILAELQADARLTMAELGRRVHLSQPAVTERVRKLEEAGVIRGYRAIVDAAMARALESSPEVLTAYGVTGEDSWILELAVSDVAHLRAALSRFCQQAATSTAIILHALREHAPIRPLPTLAPDLPAPAPTKKKPRQGGVRRG